MIDKKALLDYSDSIGGWFFRHEAEALLSVALEVLKQTPLPNVVEVGSYLGKTTVLLASAAKASGGTVFSLDPHQGEVSGLHETILKFPPSYTGFIKNITKLGLQDTVKAFCCRSQDMAWDKQSIRLLFIDGLHDYRSVMSDYQTFSPYVEVGGIIAWHDYNHNWPGVMKAADEAIASHKLSKESLIGSLLITRKLETAANLPFDIVVVTNPHKKALTLDCLQGIPHLVSVTPDYPLPNNFVLALTGQYRCVRGHQDALKMTNTNLTLVFEDDVFPNRLDWLPTICRAAELSSRFEIVSLHSRDRDDTQWNAETLRDGQEFLYRKNDSQVVAHGSMAYFITGKAKQKFLSMPWDGTPQDVLIANRFNFCTLKISPFDHDRREGSLIDIWAGRRKIHFGCGPHRIPGWINHDMDVDLRNPLPYQDASVDFIFTEHVLEHLTQRDAWNFIEECYRILKPNGAIRTVVPSIIKIEKRATPAYIKFLKDRGWGDGSKKSAQRHIVFLHEHQSLWTTELLISLKTAMGFEAYETELYRSGFPDMNNLEQHGKSIGTENNEIESISIEGVKRLKSD